MGKEWLWLRGWGFTSVEQTMANYTIFTVSYYLLQFYTSLVLSYQLFRDKHLPRRGLSGRRDSPSRLGLRGRASFAGIAALRHGKIFCQPSMWQSDADICPGKIFAFGARGGFLGKRYGDNQHRILRCFQPFFDNTGYLVFKRYEYPFCGTFANNRQYLSDRWRPQFFSDKYGHMQISAIRSGIFLQSAPVQRSSDTPFVELGSADKIQKLMQQYGRCLFSAQSVCRSTIVAVGRNFLLPF